ncbi:MAG: fumarylacetoacetate hydrolase family protein [Bacteriovoracales bacterium]
MKEIFLAKIWLNNKESLIFTDGILYSPVEDFFPMVKNFSDFLSLHTEELKIPLTNKIPDKIKYLDLIENQHIFATGVTYEWSEEKLHATPDYDVYKNLYLSEQSMFFYKGNKHNLAENFSKIGIRENTKITIPEAELVAVFNKYGEIIGYTLGNDVTALDLERENPLFQAMAKFYKGSVSMLPLIKLGGQFPITNMFCEVFRDGKILVETSYNTNGFYRSPQKIIDQLMKSKLTENGGFLFLGCGTGYPTEFGLIPGDLVNIKSDLFPINLQNTCIKI